MIAIEKGHTRVGKRSFFPSKKGATPMPVLSWWIHKNTGVKTFFDAKDELKIPSWKYQAKEVFLQKGITILAESSFLNATDLRMITLPETIVKLNAYCFAACYGLQSIISQNTIPPICGRNCFLKIKKETILSVPAESIALYKKADQWKEFTNIIAI